VLYTPRIQIPFLSDQQKILINCILKYFEGSQLVQKSNSRQSLGEFRSLQETSTWLLLHDGGMPDAVVAVQVQVHGAAVVTPQHTGSNRGYQ